MKGRSDTAGAARRRVTREDVARLAGVSVPVVTYTLNGGPKNVSPPTRERVLDAVARLGYRPNAAARALRRGHSEMLGIIVPTLDNALFAALAHEVEMAAGARGITLIVLSSASGEVADGLDRLAARQVDGVLVATPVRSADIAAIEASGLPAVLLNQASAIDGLPAIGVDLYDGARQAVAHLIERGHREIAYLGPTAGDQRRLDGWRDALRASGLRTNAVLETAFTRESGLSSGEALLDLFPRPTALFACSDQIALGALLALHQHGLDVPEMMAIASFDDSSDARYSWPPLTSVRQPLAAMAGEAVSRLLDDSSSGAQGPGAFHLHSVELVVRESS